jgi:hypothetical protein
MSERAGVAPNAVCSVRGVHLSNQRDKSLVHNDLEAVNRALATLFRTEPAALAFGAEAAMADELVVCGLLGGKDVGKSTLINALAGARVSACVDEVGEGTARPVAYVHERMTSAVTTRLRDLDRLTPIDVSTHQVDDLQATVLIDLPDFDSEFPNHLRIVRAIAPLLDRVLWVLSPRKIGDRAWVEMFDGVIKDTDNVYCVLNKVDELLTDAEPFNGRDGRGGKAVDRARSFWRAQQDWVDDFLRVSRCAQVEDRRYLVAAAFDDRERFIEHIAALWDDADWSTYEGDREAVAEVARLAVTELGRLRSGVLSPLSAEQTAHIKQANRGRERDVAAERIAQHYDLDRTIELLEDASAPEHLQRLLNEATGPAYCRALGEGLRTGMRSEAELADELLERRVERWPLLRLAYWPFGWLSRVAGRRLAARVRDTKRPAVDWLRFEGQSLEDRIESFRAHLLADHAVVAERFKLADEVPAAAKLAERTRGALDGIGPRIERDVIDSIRQRDKRPSFLGRAALWLILLWFPLIQPVSEGVLQIAAVEGAFDLIKGVYKVVAALGAVQLLAGFAVVTLIYVALLAGMYARSLRAVRRTLDTQSTDSVWSQAVDEVFATQVVVPLVEPFHERSEKLAGIRKRLRTSDEAP